MSLIGDVAKSADTVAKAFTGDILAIITLIVGLVVLKIIWLIWLTMKAQSSDRYKTNATEENKRIDERCQAKYLELEKLKADQSAHKEKLDGLDVELTLHKQMTGKDIDRIDKRLESVSADIKGLTVTVTETNRGVGQVQATLDLISKKWIRDD